MYTFVRKVFSGEVVIRTVSEMFLVLIPKVNNPESVMQFCPKGLCNTVYKAVTKVLVSKIKWALPYLVSPNQSSFVPDRYIVDNIVIARAGPYHEAGQR